MDNTIEILKKWNIWEKGIVAGIPRKGYVNLIYPYFERKEVLVLKGVRRCGKSTIVKQLIAELVKKGAEKKQILYLNLEDYGFADRLNILLFDEVLDAYKKYSNNKKKIYFFIDEVQKIPSWEKWIRTKYDLGEDIKFLVTGSSASLLSKELSTLLTGRNISFRIMPLSVTEFSRFVGKEDLDQYMKFGGFPEVVLEKSEEKKTILLRQYFEDIIYKDIIDRYAIRNTKQVLNLARYLISVSGSKVSVNKLSKVFGLAKETLQSYINYMIDTFLLLEIGFFSYSAKVKHDASKLPKLYCADNGLVCVTSNIYTKNIGKMFENTVFVSLMQRNKEVSYWSDGKCEVDFIVETTAINVTSSDKIHIRERTVVEEFKMKHHNFSLLIVSNTIKEDDGVQIIELITKK